MSFREPKVQISRQSATELGILVTLKKTEEGREKPRKEGALAFVLCDRSPQSVMTSTQGEDLAGLG
jgi:hypothetical protein